MTTITHPAVVEFVGLNVSDQKEFLQRLADLELADVTVTSKFGGRIELYGPTDQMATFINLGWAEWSKRKGLAPGRQLVWDGKPIEY